MNLWICRPSAAARPGSLFDITCKLPSSIFTDMTLQNKLTYDVAIMLLPFARETAGTCSTMTTCDTLRCKTLLSLHASCFLRQKNQQIMRNRAHCQTRCNFASLLITPWTKRQLRALRLQPANHLDKPVSDKLLQIPQLMLA